MIQTGYPKNENLDVQVVFYLSIVDQPKPEDENQYALQRSVLEGKSVCLFVCLHGLKKGFCS